MIAAGKMVAGILALPVLLAFGYLYAQRTPDNPRFYVDDDLEPDVSEIPIIEPLRLITADGGGSQAGYSRWNFQGKNMATSFHPDSLNYQKGFITFHDASQKQFGFYDLKSDKTTFLASYQQFVSFTKAKNLEKALFNTENVYSCWQQTRQLPWAKEIFAQYHGSTTK
jgi:uncharacterized protein YktA (UPF0223 family)